MSRRHTNTTREREKGAGSGRACSQASSGFFMISGSRVKESIDHADPAMRESIVMGLFCSLRDMPVEGRA